jgi:hypothetical protein
MRRIVALLLALPLLVLGCAGRDRTLQEAVSAYNALLAQGYRSMDMTPLAAAATPDRLMKAYHHMAALGEGGVKMDAAPPEIRFETVKRLSPTEAEVVTRESWRYRYVALQGNQAGRESTVHYTARYRLAHQEGKWLVADLQILATDKTDDSDLLPFLKRPAEESPGSGNVMHNERDGDAARP